MVSNAHYLHRMTIQGALAALAPAVGRNTLCNTMLPVILSCATDKVPSVCRIHLPYMHTFIVLRPKLLQQLSGAVGVALQGSLTAFPTLMQLQES